MEVDFLLIGQGLAGTALSYRMAENGLSFIIYDTPAANVSSRVAAGLYNPVTGKKMVRTWLADRLFPEIEPFYQSLEEFLGKRFLVQKQIYRPFLNIEEQNEWMGHSGDPFLQPYFEKIFTREVYKEVINPYGGILLKNSGYLEIPVLLDAYAKRMVDAGFLRQEYFDEEVLLVDNEGVRYKDVKAKGIIFCNGLGAMKSHFFSNLPFAPVKGEIMDIQQEFHPEEIINRGVFRISLSNGLHRVGSTYSWHDLELGPTERGKNEILEKLDKLVKLKERQIVRHVHGLRPATKDRRPFLGKHPSFKNVYIFNGFGAKGVSLIPYFSKVFMELLIEGKEPEIEANIKRCK
ncbi:NAD(P)/FAD-dependent oxidoreductase [Cecembia rubra]|uniref:Glycine/D-amino acid oxidase-like deaminating enzyme n=1 Tax=Cecembia rubra TaxID=1485585 RepID=A0A2P8DW52_9BACT|nr:FAD-binding oxidoreductase [Cecembia rubra]PSL01450.1 glycine/D-amino acid oxidase-like deaminating enzyme [Cecembia rubra]